MAKLSPGSCAGVVAPLWEFSRPSGQSRRGLQWGFVQAGRAEEPVWVPLGPATLSSLKVLSRGDTKLPVLSLSVLSLPVLSLPQPGCSPASLGLDFLPPKTHPVLLSCCASAGNRCSGGMWDVDLHPGSARTLKVGTGTSGNGQQPRA